MRNLLGQISTAKIYFCLGCWEASRRPPLQKWSANGAHKCPRHACQFVSKSRKMLASSNLLALLLIIIIFLNMFLFPEFDVKVVCNPPKTLLASKRENFQAFMNLQD